MARPTKKSAAKLRAKLKAAAKRRKHAQPLSQREPTPVDKSRFTHEITKERIRLGVLLARIEKQALGELRGHELYERPKEAWGKVSLNKDGTPKMITAVRSTEMTPLQLAAAQYLVDKIVPKAEAPKQLELSGSITVIDRDPTQRPAGYDQRRKGKASLKSASPP